MLLSKVFHNTGREVEVEWSTEKDMDTFNCGFYYKVAGSSGEGRDIGGMWSAIKNDIFCSHNRRNISGGIGKVALGQCMKVT